MQSFIKEQYILIHNPICPFAQRVVITVKEKNIQNIQLRQVDLKEKSKFFKQTYAKAQFRNPNSEGQVPILIIKKTNQNNQNIQQVISQSDIISWYLSEKYYSKGNSLIPQDLLQRAKMRYFLTNANVPGRLISAFYSFYNYPTKSQQQKNQSKDKSLKALQYVQQNIKGPYTMGDYFCLSDIFLFPWLMRWCVHQKLFDIKISQQKYPKILKFIKLMENRPSIKQNRIDNEQIIKSYTPYFGFN